MYSKTLPSEKHETKVCSLTVGDLLQMSNDGLINCPDIDKVYYHLLDSVKVREYLKTREEENQDD
jgi:hypothetical protein